MNLDTIHKELQNITKTPGIEACALVVIETGMVLLNTSKDRDFEVIAEGSRDYWVLQHRNGHVFKPIGDVKIIFVFHKKRVISVQACVGKTLLITLAETKGVDWNQWQKVIRPLMQKVKEFEEAKQPHS